MRQLSIPVIVMLICLNSIFPAFLIGQTVPPGFFITTVGSGWNEPVGTAFSKTGTKLFVWQKDGKVYVSNWNTVTHVYDKQSTPVLDISEEVGDWRDHGLLGFALDPNYDLNNFIYLLYVVDRHYLIYYGTPNYNPATNDYLSATIGRITRYKTKINNSQQLVADLSTRTILLGESKTTGIPILHESHGVGSLVFAADGTLLASCGDAASYNAVDVGSLSETYYAQALTDGIIRANENVGALRSQMINSLNGKILRLDPANGNGVSSNPFYSAASPRSAKSRMWAMGFRNPFRFTIKPNTGSTNPATGDIGEIYVGDVGWNTYEELNIIKGPAENAGWPLFEGLTYMAGYANTSIQNKDEPNPLYGSGGCNQQYFTFNNLIKQATADNDNSLYNPCSSNVPIASPNKNRFFHRIPSMDWKHGIDSARVGVFNGNTLGIAEVGSTASGVQGITFRGNCSVGGCWYTGNLFPPAYHNTYFHADYGGTWLKNFTVQYTDKVSRVDTFSKGYGAIVQVSYNPLDGSLFCIDMGSASVKKISYGGNQPPVVKLSSNKLYGPAPLTVNFTGSNSYDPEGGQLTYQWNFGDGTANSTLANPTHTFTTGNNLPKKFVVILTVRDSVNSSAIDSIIISANNTPPQVSIYSPINNTYYYPGTDTTYQLRANVTDLEHSSSQLSYVWQTVLRHSNHEHPEPIDTNKLTSSVISRIGCNGDSYYWLVKLKVTDAAGAVGSDSAKIFPFCGGVLPLVLSSFSVNYHNNISILTWSTQSETNLNYFEVERSYDGFSFEPMSQIMSIRSAGSYEFRDSDHLSGYLYYRIQLVDISGNSIYSPVIRINELNNDKDNFGISPNPARNECVISGNSSQKGNGSIRIIDRDGRIVRSFSHDLIVGFNRILINNLEQFPAGVYVIELNGKNVLWRNKMIIVK